MSDENKTADKHKSSFPEEIYADDDLVCAEEPDHKCRVKYVRTPASIESKLKELVNLQKLSLITELQARVATLESAFRHIHKRGPNGDVCATCGLDLRDSIHSGIL